MERVNQVLEDMRRACVISFDMKWEDCLPFAEFSYNNSYQASSGKAPFEILYGRKCRTPLNWSETGECQTLGNGGNSYLVHSQPGFDESGATLLVSWISCNTFTNMARLTWAS